MRIRTETAKYTVGFLCCFFLAKPCKGTSIIIIQKADGILVAADSKVSNTNATIVRTDYCKVNLSGTPPVISAVDGLLFEGQFDLANAARDLGAGNSTNSQENLNTIANKWGAFAKSNYNRQIRDHFEWISKTILEYDREKRDLYSEAIFLGFDVSGKPIKSLVRVTAKQGKSGRISVGQGPINMELARAEHQIRIEALGDGNDVWAELQAQKSQRSKESSNLLKQLRDGDPEVKPFTELAGEWFPKTVGGPTDIVLFEGGTSRWIARKPTCGN
jgi:hypothetical protein